MRGRITGKNAPAEADFPGYVSCKISSESRTHIFLGQVLKIGNMTVGKSKRRLFVMGGIAAEICIHAHLLVANVVIMRIHRHIFHSRISPGISENRIRRKGFVAETGKLSYAA